MQILLLIATILALLGLVSAAKPTPEEGVQFQEAFAQEEGVVKTASGLLYKVLEKSSQEGAKRPTKHSQVQVHYKGTLIDGSEFDSSYKRGQPATFPLSGVIAGWTEGVQLMHEGDKFQFVIKPDLAYGERAMGSILPASSTLVFEVELLQVQSKWAKDEEAKEEL
ncbi:MAG: hypothetical protein MHM6MM_004958 [Cercozoa sp. M6MM]